MKTRITNYRGIASAEILLTGIALVAGRNGAGKSSTAQAIGAALTGDAVPVDGVTKSTAGQLVRSGTAKGSVCIETDDGMVDINWPKADVKVTGKAPVSSVFAAGLQNVLEMKESDRIKTLTKYLKAEPTRADLDAKLAPMKLPATTVDRLWELIEAQGWDGAHAQVKEKGAKLKGQWELVTNDNYGAKKAETWIPEGYEPNLEGASENNLQACVTDARDNLESAIAVTAVDDSKRGELQELVDSIPMLKEKLAGLGKEEIDDTDLEKLRTALTDEQKTLSTLRDKLQQGISYRDKLPQPKQPKGTECPKCKALLQISGESLHEIKGLSEDEMKARKDMIDKAGKSIAATEAKIKEQEIAVECANKKYSDKLSTISKQKQILQDMITDTKNKITTAENAAKELAETPEAVQSTGVSVDDCRTALAVAEKRMKAFQSKHQADSLRNSIAQNQELLKHIASDGVRGDVLVKALGSVNEAMATLCNTAGWGRVELTNDFNGQYAGTPYHLLSESEQWRVDVTLRVAMARIDKSACIIVDRADILDKAGRNGLFKMLRGAGPALVCMTLDSRELMPDLEKAGMGHSYWIGDDGVVS